MLTSRQLQRDFNTHPPLPKPGHSDIKQRDIGSKEHYKSNRHNRHLQNIPVEP